MNINSIHTLNPISKWLTVIYIMSRTDTLIICNKCGKGISTIFDLEKQGFKVLFQSDILHNSSINSSDILIQKDFNLYCLKCNYHT